MSTKRLKIVFLMEVKVGKAHIERIKNKLQFEGMFSIESVRGGGGLAFLWKEEEWVKLVSYSMNHVDVVVTIPGMATWRLTGFYGMPEKSQRMDSWNLLRTLSSRFSLSWCCIGDFNDLLAQSEKRGRLDHPNYLIQGFRDTIDSCGLRDIGMDGYPFT